MVLSKWLIVDLQVEKEGEREKPGRHAHPLWVAVEVEVLGAVSLVLGLAGPGTGQVILLNVTQLKLFL